MRVYWHAAEGNAAYDLRPTYDAEDAPFRAAAKEVDATWHPFQVWPHALEDRAIATPSASSSSSLAAETAAVVKAHALLRTPLLLRDSDIWTESAALALNWVHLQEARRCGIE